MVPRSGLSNPAIERISVVFPLPLAPTTPRISPRFNEKEIESIIFVPAIETAKSSTFNSPKLLESIGGNEEVSKDVDFI
jgi:hypothetical protein